MNLRICSYCGAHGGPQDQEIGRCGNCASFFTGNEELIECADVETSENESGPEDTTSSSESQTAEGSNGDEPKEIEGRPEPGGFDPTKLEPIAEIESSEGLVRPRRLSAGFRRRVEMTWQGTFGGAAQGAQSTLSSGASSQGTRSATSTLSISTRRIAKPSETGKGDYELREVIGEGSMGRVWSARQSSLDRNVAVKIPRPELASAGSIGESQFISEVVVTGKLEHPNIVPIYELGRAANGTPFYSMKHVQGLPWNELIEEKSEQENLEILMKVCDAIAFAHDRNFLHRDIKPHNVMVGEFGEVSVMDWGIAISLAKDPDQPWGRRRERACRNSRLHGA